MKEKQTVTKTLVVVMEVTIEDGKEMDKEFELVKGVEDGALQMFVYKWEKKVMEVRLK